MNWNDHSQLEGKHAFLSASQYRWLNYDEGTLFDRLKGQYATTIGTVAHDLAHDCIIGRIKLHSRDRHLIDYAMFKNYIPAISYDADNILSNMIPFVNDAIGYRMSSEVVLYYSRYCFGTADAILYDEVNHILRIHDLKTGDTPAHMEQLLIYAALFYLEYHYDPNKTQTILRIYQSGQINELIADPKDVKNIMNLIIDDCAKITDMLGGVK